MTENELKTLLKTVTSPNKAVRAAAHAHWAALAKPLGGLGRLETMVEDAAVLSAAGAAELDAAELPHAAKESMSAVAVAIESAFFMCSKTSI